jgi:hypothetical protein
MMRRAWSALREAHRDHDAGTRRPRLLDGLLVVSTTFLAVGAFADDWLFRVGLFLFLLVMAVFYDDAKTARARRRYG